MRAAGPPSGVASLPIAASCLGSGYRFFRELKKCVDTYAHQRTHPWQKKSATAQAVADRVLRSVESPYYSGRPMALQTLVLPML